jgi:hypothetical protein
VTMLIRSSPLPRFLLSLPCALLPLALGCNHSVFSPPARAVPLETAATLPKGDTGVQLEGGGSGALFGPGVASGTARVRHGVTGDLDVSFEGSLMRIVDTPEPAVDLSRNVYAARAGVKARLHPALSVAGGVGGGASAGGAFVSPDVGPIVAWENRYVVPFLSARGGVSQPLGAKKVDTSTVDDGPGTFVESPRTTWLVSVTTGVRVPLGWAEPEAGKTRGSLLAGVGMTHLADTRDDATFSHLAFGGELVF